MKTCFSNSTVMWNETEIIRRESLIREIPLLLANVWMELNPQVRFERTETPILTPERFLKSHIAEGFCLIPFGKGGYLRPETTSGTYEAFEQRFAHHEQLLKHLPYCMWQVGLSFREELNPDTMRVSKLRLRQFYQMEFQLFARNGTKAPYLDKALEVLTKFYGGYIECASERPHYSNYTLDWYIDELEVAGASIRTDWPHGMVYEVAIGLDRLVALQMAHPAKKPVQEVRV